MTTINISSMNKAAVLAALYNRSSPLGSGFFVATPGDMSNEEAKELLDSGETYFDYLKGRVMKVDLSGDELRTHLYDRDNGEGAAASALSKLAAT